MGELTPFDQAVRATSAALHSGWALLASRDHLNVDDRRSAAELSTRALYGVGLAESVLPAETPDLEPGEPVAELATYASRVRHCEQELLDLLPTDCEPEQLGYVTFIADFAERVEAHARRAG